jgi:hypothetical protein
MFRDTDLAYLEKLLSGSCQQSERKLARKRQTWKRLSGPPSVSAGAVTKMATNFTSAFFDPSSFCRRIFTSNLQRLAAPSISHGEHFGRLAEVRVSMACAWSDLPRLSLQKESGAPAFPSSQKAKTNTVVESLGLGLFGAKFIVLAALEHGSTRS